MEEKIKLTQTVAKGGCAAKVSAVALHEILAGVRFPPVHPQLLIDGSTFDDAAVYQVTEDTALVQTLDFFTPIVDDAYTFGAVASANALSDVYAMGGIPKTCLAILAFPIAKFPSTLGTELLQGAADKIAESGATFVGGHSIDDDTLKFGLSVTGFVHPKKMWSNAGAKPGDVLLLTKPLGTGTLVAGLKSGKYQEVELQEVIESMMQLNRVSERIPSALANAIHAATDVTGFGLSGHAQQVAQASGVTFEIALKNVPVFGQTYASLAQGNLTKAHASNKTYTAAQSSFTDISDEEALVVFDPQTSGGLLLAVAPEAANGILESLKPTFPHASIIGTVKPKQTHAVVYSRT